MSIPCLACGYYRCLNYEKHTRIILTNRRIQRIDSLSEILQNSLEAGIKRIYIVVDLAPTLEGQEQQSLIFKMLEKHKESFDIFKVYKRNKNVGCAVSVLTGLDWILRKKNLFVF